MRPATAASKKSQSTSRLIWKKFESTKPQKNNFYCFKTITQILEGHHKRSFKEDKKEIYYQIINEPTKLLQEKTFQKQNYHKRSSHQLQRNPTMKKVMSNNFLSTKQIGKEMPDINSILKIKTQNEIKSDTKFLPYREQSISIIKHSKILNNEGDNCTKQVFSNNDMKNKGNDDMLNRKRATITMVMNKKKQRPCKTEISSSINDKQFPHYHNNKRQQENDKQFMIQQWDNFDEENSNFSLLINNNCRMS